MSTEIRSDNFAKALFALLDETFDNVHGFYLDKGTSLFETLATISSDEASIPVGGRCATLAAQVKHIAFYLDVLEKGSAHPTVWERRLGQNLAGDERRHACWVG